MAMGKVEVRFLRIGRGVVGVFVEGDDVDGDELGAGAEAGFSESLDVAVRGGVGKPVYVSVAGVIVRMGGR